MIILTACIFSSYCYVFNHCVILSFFIQLSVHHIVLFLTHLISISYDYNCHLIIFVILSSCHLVILSSCRLVILLYYHLVILSSSLCWSRSINSSYTNHGVYIQILSKTHPEAPPPPHSAAPHPRSLSLAAKYVPL